MERALNAGYASANANQDSFCDCRPRRGQSPVGSAGWMMCVHGEEEKNATYNNHRTPQPPLPPQIRQSARGESGGASSVPAAGEVLEHDGLQQCQAVQCPVCPGARPGERQAKIWTQNGLIYMKLFLSQRWKQRGISVFSVHPGNMVSTDISRNYWFYRLLFAIVRPFTKSLVGVPKWSLSFH